MSDGMRTIVYWLITSIILAVLVMGAVQMAPAAGNAAYFGAFIGFLVIIVLRWPRR